MRRRIRSESQTRTPRDSSVGGVELSIVAVSRADADAEAFRRCVVDASSAVASSGVRAEIVVALYGPESKSAIERPETIARRLGLRVVRVDAGYGAAVRAGVAVSRGEYVITAPADGSYDLRQFPRFLMRLRAGADLVQGTRRTRAGGRIEGRLGPLERYVFAPLCDAVARHAFGAECNDSQCEFRGARREFLQRLELQSNGRELGLEIAAKSALRDAQLAEAPVVMTASVREPLATRLQTQWRRGRLACWLCPQWALSFPGYLTMLLGLAMFFLAASETIFLSAASLAPAYIGAAAATIVGFQLLQFGVLTKQSAIRTSLLPSTRGDAAAESDAASQRGLLLGALAFAVGVVLFFAGARPGLLAHASAFATAFRLCTAGAALMAIGIQLVSAELIYGLVTTAAGIDTPLTRQTMHTAASKQPRLGRMDTGAVERQATRMLDAFRAEPVTSEERELLRTDTSPQTPRATASGKTPSRK